MIHKESYGPTLTGMPIIKHQIGLQNMNRRSDFTKRIYTKFSHILAKDAGNYRDTSQQIMKPSADVKAMATNKLPLQLRMHHGAAFGAMSKPSILCSLDDLDHDEQIDEVTDKQLAAVMEQVEKSSKYSDNFKDSGTRKRSWEGQRDFSRQGVKPRRSYQDSSHTERSQERPGTFQEKRVSFSSGARGDRDDATHRPCVRGLKPPTGQLPPEAPRPDGLEDDIRQYIISQGVCFYHARGQQCPNMVNHTRCNYSHTQQPIPWGVYPRKKRTSKERELALIQLEQLDHSEASEGTASLNMMTSSSTTDNPHEDGEDSGDESPSNK